MPDDRVLHQFPEAATLALLDTALVAAELSLRAEHPAIDDVPLDLGVLRAWAVHLPQ